MKKIPLWLWTLFPCFILISVAWSDMKRIERLRSQIETLEAKNFLLQRTHFATTGPLQLEQLGISVTSWQVPRLLGGTIETVLTIPNFPEINACVVLNGTEPVRLAITRNATKGAKIVCREYSISYLENKGAQTNTLSVIVGEMFY